MSPKYSVNSNKTKMVPDYSWLWLKSSSTHRVYNTDTFDSKTHEHDRNDPFPHILSALQKLSP